MNTKLVKFKPDEIQILLDILIETCYGCYGVVSINEFKQKIGVEKTEAVELMNKILEEKDKEESILSLNETELLIFFKSFEEVFRQIEEWEFQTLIGVTISEAERIREKVRPPLPNENPLNRGAPISCL